VNFFEHQDAARHKTSLLVIYFALAVVSIVVAVYLAFALVFLGVETKVSGETDLTHLWNPSMAIWVLGITIAIVVIGSLSKIVALRGGGAAVAEHLGGRLLDPGSSAGDERKLLNVIEEMAIASGTPVPPVYLIEEDSINAFAAGYTPGNAVIGVTRGCMEKLNRAELQGVMAHEFSHILNGDMRLNIRLMGILNGILVIGIVGYFLLRSSMYSSMYRARRRENNQMPLVVLGACLMGIGYIGVFFGKLIKSAVSRQREFLADASAVQFTREPDGIAGALKRIGGYERGSRIEHPHAEEASHLFFANGLSSRFTNLLATHPPLDERIQRIDPRFTDEQRSSAAVAPTAAPPPARAAGLQAFAGESRMTINPETVVEQIGAPQSAHIDYAVGIIASIPENLTRAAHEPFGARAVVYGILLNSDPGARGKQLKRLQTAADPEVYAETERLMSALTSLPRAARLPLVDLALPALRGLSARQFTAFSENVRHLIEADDQIDLFEFALHRILLRHLAPAYKRIPPAPVKHRQIPSALPVLGRLLSTLAYLGHETTEAAQAAFRAATAQLPPGLRPDLSQPDQCSMQILDEALTELDGAAPSIKKLVIQSCVACITADERICIEEAELIRAIGDALGCPVPPFLPDVT
jgi:Zn-dependent protease with chaperone function